MKADSARSAHYIPLRPGRGGRLGEPERSTLIDPARLSFKLLASLALLAAVSAPLSAQPAAAPPPEAATPADPTLLPASFRCFIPIRRASEGIYEKGLRGLAAADRLRAWHEHLASEPHPSGSPGDLAVIDFTAPGDGEFAVKVHDFLYAGSPEHFYRLALSAAPRIDFVLPPAGVPGATGA